MGVVDLVRSLSDKNTLEKDMTDALLLVSSLFHDRYIKSLKKEIEDRCHECHRNPSREMNLVKSIKPFLREERHIMHIDRAIDIVNKFDAAKSIHRDVTTQSRHTECEDYTYRRGRREDERGGCGCHHGDRHRHGHHCEDVYEIDERCRCTRKIGKISLAAAAVYFLFRRF